MEEVLFLDKDTDPDAHEAEGANFDVPQWSQNITEKTLLVVSLTPLDISRAIFLPTRSGPWVLGVQKRIVEEVVRPDTELLESGNVSLSRISFLTAKIQHHTPERRRPDFPVLVRRHHEEGLKDFGNSSQPEGTGRSCSMSTCKL